ncbi:sugar kinase [Acidovorax sp. 1608163]|uniref:sugar kinase n=1 Tax=Acidovorax sp. 1608163 TaxID=2478662 RepID=UPI000EF6C2CB|nr:sugar kinase [Acidovorax sp. 1608163]AYM96998.1 sugar kinase [Acidovorax sp. 1608163]
MNTAQTSTSTVQALDVLTVGEPMALFMALQPGELHVVPDFRRVPAGAELNVATGLARLGLATGYITRLGQDSFGNFLRGVLAHEGIDTRYVVADASHPTGFMLKTRSDDGSDPQIEYFRKGSAASHLSVADAPVDEGNTFPARHLHLTGITPALSPTTRELAFYLARQARAAGASISFDPNLRPRLWPSTEAMAECINALAALSDTVLPGLAEGRQLTGRHTAEDIAVFYLERGARQVVVKLGPEGAYYAQQGGACGMAPGLRVERVVDTVGAGDGFAVGVVSGLLEGLALAQAAARGNAIGARVVQFPGDADGLPTRQELDEGR